MPTITPTQRLASLILGEPVVGWLEARRAEGLSWRLIARELEKRSNGQLDITHETLRLWVEEAQRVA